MNFKAYSHKRNADDESLHDAWECHVAGSDVALDQQKLVLFLADGVDVLNQWIFPSQHLDSQITSNEFASQVDTLVCHSGSFGTAFADVFGQQRLETVS